MVRKAWETKGGTTAVARRGAGTPHIPRTGFLSGRRPAPGTSTALVPAQLAPAGYPLAHPGTGYPGHYAGAGIPGAYTPVPLPVLHQRPGAAPSQQGQMVPAGGTVLNGIVLDAAQVAAMEPVLARAGRAVRRAAWRRRWELTPAYAGTAVLVAGTAAPVTATGALAAVAAAAYAAARWAPHTVAGRAWLSARERMIAAAWCAGGTVWAGVQAAGWVHPGRGTVAALVAVTGPQALLWARSRRIRPVEDIEPDTGMSAKAAELIAAWPVHVAPTGPAPLVGSHIDPATMREPAGGAFAFGVELDESVHGQTVTGDTVRQHIERRLRLPVGCVELGVDPDDSGRVLVTMTPGRWLENAPAPWAGPVLNEDGSIDFATTRDGTTVPAILHNDAGVEHGAIFGCTGVGKSNSLVTMVLPGVWARREVLWYIDGGNGSSAGHLAGACDVWAVSDLDQWREVINAAHRVLRARKDRRSKLGRSSWRGAREVDPILTLVIDEATTVVEALREAKDKTTESKVLEILREGRKVGVRVIQLAQDPMGTDLIGGRKARGLMCGGGTLVGHRPGDQTANTLATGSTAKAVDLRTLPPEAGWVAVVNKGKVLAACCRVAYAPEEKVEEMLIGFGPRTLVGADVKAAGPMYAGRVHGPDAATAIIAARRAEEAEAAGDLPHLPIIDPTHPTTHEVQDDVATTTPGNAADQLAASAARLAQPMRALAAVPGQPVDHVDQGADVIDGALTIGAPPFVPALTGSQLAARQTAEANRAAVLDVILAGGGDPVSRAHIVTETGLGLATIKRALKALRDAEQVSAAEGGGWTAIESAV